MNTGEAIGVMAKRKGFNLRQLAAKAGVPYNTLYAIVKRKSSRIDGKTLRRVADALEVSIDELEPFTPKVMRLDADESWVVGSRFDTVVTTRMVDADTREARKAAKDDVLRLLQFFDLLDGKGQTKAVELMELLSKVPEYRNPAAGERQPSKEITDEVIAEYVDMRKAESEAAIYGAADKLLAAVDAGNEDEQLKRMQELMMEHEAVGFIGDLSDEKFQSLFGWMESLITAHKEGNEDEEHRLIEEFINTSKIAGNAGEAESAEERKATESEILE